jgi:glucose/arabinose dehydrogenase
VPDPTSSSVNGRPVGVAVAPDGSLLVSDDGANVIYRISAAK